MRAKVSKVLRRLAAVTQSDYRALKQAWRRIPRTQRSRARNAALDDIRAATHQPEAS